MCLDNAIHPKLQHKPSSVYLYDKWLYNALVQQGQIALQRRATPDLETPCNNPAPQPIILHRLRLLL